MNRQSRRENLKDILAHIIADFLLPLQIRPRVEESLGVKPDPRVMDQAVASAQDKVRRIIDQIPHLNSQAFFLRIPNLEFLEFLLMSEYILQNSVQGERAVMRHLRHAREPEPATLANCLAALGFMSLEDLEPYEDLIKGKLEDGEEFWERIKGCLDRAEG